MHACVQERKNMSECVHKKERENMCVFVFVCVQVFVSECVDNKSVASYKQHLHACVQCTCV